MASGELRKYMPGGAAWSGALWLVASIAGSSLAEEARPVPEKPANAWAVNCASGSTGTDLQCQVSQNLTEAKTGKRVLTVTVRPQEGGLAMLIALPHGLFLPAGASYQIDTGRKATVAIQTSDQNGAYAAVPLAPDLLAAMKAGTNLNIGMESVTRNAVTIPVSLAGFTAAIDKLNTTQ